MTNKKNAKQAYLQNPPLAGIYRIKNLQTGKQLLNSAQNPQGALERHRFELKFKQSRNPSLQQDWNHYGETEFTFELLEKIKPDEQNPKRALIGLLEKWTNSLERNHAEHY